MYWISAFLETVAHDSVVNGRLFYENPKHGWVSAEVSMSHKSKAGPVTRKYTKALSLSDNFIRMWFCYEWE